MSLEGVKRWFGFRRSRHSLHCGESQCKKAALTPSSRPFAGDTLTIHPAAGVEKKSTFKLETSKSKVMIVQQNESGAGTEPARSPYELSGDTLKIAFGGPKNLSADVSEKGLILFTLQRKKS